MNWDAEMKSERKKLGTGSMLDDVVIMAEGNPGAVSVMAQIMGKQKELGYLTILCLDDMNIRGEQIWLGYKDFCSEVIEVFIEKIESRDEKMVDFINSYYERYNKEFHKAVVAGANFTR